jgi:farnesyl-diphosphate farnesyltransferase
MADLDQLLEKTSRTFALAIPLLPEPTRGEVTLAYLLFRIADTFEDAAVWPRERRIAALEDFARLLETPSTAEAERLARRWRDELPSDHPGYLELLGETPAVLAAFLELSPEARRIVGHHTCRTARLMSGFVARSDDGGRLELVDLDDLSAYCYAVAGIVGEMLTDLFLLGRPALAGVAEGLRRRAAAFGEGLQLVNILKDAADDADEGRRFLPRGTDRAAVFARARGALDEAAEYVLALQDAPGGAERGLVAFTALPLRLAWASLDRVERHGAGSKLTRPEVFSIVADLDRALDRGEPAVTPPRSAAASPHGSSLLPTAG